MWPFTTTPPPPQDDFLTNIIYFGLLWLVWKIYLETGRRKKRMENLPTLDEVIGLTSVKEEIQYYMKLVDDPEKYQEWNVQLPKGILLVGPPGTGKTLLVKAIAKELEIPIEIAAGSDFVEMYVGVGAARVRALFDRARQHEKCVIFIDEIDAVGSVRDVSHNSERANTLNQLLVEMDGFDSTNQIIIFAATNLAKYLDPALLRSGRFDKKVFFDLPNVKEREEMFELYLGDTEVSDEIAAKKMAKRTTGMTGADISNIVNQAKLNAISSEHSRVTNEDMDIAIDEVMIGREKRERTLSHEERERVAHHEAGHALTAYLLKGARKPLKVSIIPRGEIALGFSQDQPDDRRIYIREEIIGKIAVLLGGRVAEQLVYGDMSTGAGDDIEKISELLNSYVTRWGMASDYGPVNPRYTDTMEEELSFTIIQRISCRVEEFVETILRDHFKYLKKLAKHLLKKETIFYEDIVSIVKAKRKDSIHFPLETLEVE